MKYPKIKLIIIPRYKTKILVQKEKNELKFLYCYFKKGEQPEFSVNHFLQTKLFCLAEDIKVYKVFSDKNNQVNIIYQVFLREKDYINILDKKNYLWYEIDGVDFDKIINYDDLVLRAELKSQSLENDDDQYYLYTDGGSRGNPGHSGIGYSIIKNNGDIIFKNYEYIGITTSAIAEYQALIRGLQTALLLDIKKITCRIDNLMIVKQLNNEYQVKNRELKPINEKINNLIKQFDDIKFIHVKREFNQVADSLVNKALDEYLLKK